MTVSFGLYYPYIHFKDDNWLKLSALYFDKMYRIVPESYETKDSDTVKGLADFVDYVRPQWANEAFGKTFIEFVDGYHVQLRDIYGLHNIDSWPRVPHELMPPTAGGASGIDPRLSYVYFEKIPVGLRERLLLSGLARFDAGDDRWVGMHPKIARVYMTALADQLAGERKLQPMTDEVIDHWALSGLTPERLAQLLLGDIDLVDDRPTQHEVEQTFALLSLRTVMPKDLGSVTIDKLAKVREQLAGERGKFQTAVMAFAKDNASLRELPDDRALEDYLKSEITKTITPERQKLRDALRANDIDVVLGAMSLKVEVPALLATGLSTLGVAAIVNPVVGAVLGVSLLAAKVLRDRRKGRQALLASSSASYLFRIEEALAPGILAGWIGQDALRLRFVH